MKKEPKVMFSNDLLCPKPKNIQLTIIQKRKTENSHIGEAGNRDCLECLQQMINQFYILD